MSKKPPILLFNLQRCGSNLLQKAMSENFDMWLANDAVEEWKHGFLPRHVRTRNAFLIICVRNPYAWMNSMFRYLCKHHGKDKRTTALFPKFQPGVTKFQDFIRQATSVFNSPAQMWSVMNDHYYARLADSMASGKGGYLCKSEETSSEALQHDTFMILANEYLGAGNFDSSNIITYGNQINNMTQDTGEPMPFAFYGTKKYLDGYNEDDLEFVNGHLDKTVMSDLGYQIED